jgi:hypothetical protein
VRRKSRHAWACSLLSKRIIPDASLKVSRRTGGAYRADPPIDAASARQLKAQGLGATEIAKALKTGAGIGT